MTDQYSQKRRVVIFRTELLRPSETFIRDQTLALSKWTPLLVGFREVAGGLDTSGIMRTFIKDTGTCFVRAYRFWMSRPIPSLVKALKNSNAELVHVHFGTDATDIWPSVKAANLPMIVTLHGYDINIRAEWWQSGNGGLRRRLYPWRLRRLGRHTTIHFIAVSDAIKKSAIEYGIPASKISVQYTGVNTKIFRPGKTSITKRPKRIIFIGRLVEKKGAAYLIRAFDFVLDIVPDAELIIIGDGPQRGMLEAQAEAKKHAIKFLGAATRETIIAELHQARVLCLPSLVAKNGDAEGFGLVLLEAQACGVPVVTSALGGACEGLIDKKTGFSINEGDSIQLGRQLSKILMDERSLKSMSIAARQFVLDQFDLDMLTSRLEKTYDLTASRMHQSIY